MDRRTWGRRIGVLLAAVLGTVVGLAVAPRVQADVGPFVMSASARPALYGHTTIRLVPLGSIRLDTHDVPVAVDMRLEELNAAEAEAIADDPTVLAGLEDDLAADARSVLLAVSWRAALAGLAGGAVGAVLAYRTRRAALAGLAVGFFLVGATGAAARLTFNAQAVAEPQYSGLLANAPTVIGDIDAVLERFGEYRAQLGELVSNTVTLYRAGQQLPDFEPGDTAVRVLHVSDIHNNPQAFDLIDRLVSDFNVDAVVDTGDISDWGTGAETALTDPIGRLDVPYVFVRGNHDSAATERAIAALPNAVVLDGSARTVAGLRMWGIGDPRFTPDKRGETGVDVERRAIREFAPVLRRRLAASTPPSVALVMVHDSRAAADVLGDVPLVLAGHMHEPRHEVVDETTVLLEGSTGGAGLRALHGEFPEPLTCTLLYFDPRSDRLVAYDRITVAGLGSAAAGIERHLVHTKGPPPQRVGWGVPKQFS